MKRSKERIEDYFAMVLREGDGALLWEKLGTNPSIAGIKSDLSPSHDQFFRQIDRFIAKHRLAIATAHSRYMLRRWMESAREQHRAVRPLTGLSVQEPPVNI